MCKCVRTWMCVCVCVLCIFVPPLHDFVCLHPEMWPCEPAIVCVCVCTCEHEQQRSSFPASPASAQCHNEEPGGDSRGRGGEALTAATCHISQLKFGRNQFGTLILSTTPTPGAAEEAWPLATPSPPPTSPQTTSPKDEESTPGGTQVINLKSPLPN